MFKFIIVVFYQCWSVSGGHFSYLVWPGNFFLVVCVLIIMALALKVCTLRVPSSYTLWIHYFEHSRRSIQSSIFLSGCAALRLHWGRWGQPCPPLYWTAVGSSAAPPPSTEWSAAGCHSAQPPPHRRAPPEYWPTGGWMRERFKEDSTGHEGRESFC